MKLILFSVLLISHSPWISGRSFEKSVPDSVIEDCENAAPDQHLVANPESCHSFYSCVEQADGGYSPVLMNCPANLGFDVEKQRCDWPETVASCSPVTCEDGWQLFEGSCYLFSRDKIRTFAEALETCQAQDAYLVEVNSEEEDKFLVGVAESLMTGPNDGLDYWMGGQDIDNDGVWEWATSGEPIGYSNFWSDQGSLNGRCLQLIRKGNTQPRTLDTFYWAKAASNGDCSNRKDSDNGYICEKNA